MDCKPINLDIDSDSVEEHYMKLERLLSMQEQINGFIAQEEEMIETKLKMKATFSKLKTEKRSNSSKGWKKPKHTLVPPGMEYKDILQLSLDINKLPRDKLMNVVHIIRSREKPFKHTDVENFFVDFQKLMPSTLRRLKEYLKESENI